MTRMSRMFTFANRRPDFLILGAQKSGTSALEFFLSQHPRIRCAKRKEVGFFNRDKCYARGEEWYGRHFGRRWRSGLLFFEATPEYLYYPFVAERIFRFDPRMKLIALLRDPVERAFSAWNMFRQMHNDPEMKEAAIRHFLADANAEVQRALVDLLRAPEFPDFCHCVERELEAVEAGRSQPLEPSFVRRGIYREQVERFYRFFPSDNLLILESKELKTDRRACLNRVLQFLGLPEADWDRTNLEDQHARPYAAQMDEGARKRLEVFFAPENAGFYRLIGRDFGWGSGAPKPSSGQDEPVGCD